MRSATWALLVFVSFPALAWAGMPTVRLTEVARVRLENISFFLMLFFLSAWLIQLLWNYLGRDWTFLPRLRYPAALGIVTLWSLLFVLVLTMISGARELMTPGAWEPKGATYRLAGAEREAELRRARHAQLEKLRDALWDHAFKHEGKFPPTLESDAVSAALSRMPDPSLAPYVYIGGGRSSDAIPVVFEPDVFGRERYVLYADGSIRQADLDSILAALPPEKR